MTNNNEKLINYYSGLSGLALPIPKYLYPKEHASSSRLAYYSSFFNSIEINSTFYKLPLEKTIFKWSTLVYTDFKFTFKLWQEITHVKNLDFKEPDVERFFTIVNGVGNKKGCILIQFPPSISKVYIKQLESLLRCVEKNNNKEWKIAVEFRNKSWYDGDVYDLLQSNNATMVLHDIAKSLTPMITHLSDFMYVRFHGPTGNYRGSYSEFFLAEYATYIKEWLEEGKTVYAYFNNTMGDAFKNLQTLNQAILSKK